MSRVVVLDSGPLGALCNAGKKKGPHAASQWFGTLMSNGVRVVVPEIADYEVRRELLRAGKGASIEALNGLWDSLSYWALTTAAMRRAAELWADARQSGRPTAGDDTIDADMILCARSAGVGRPRRRRGHDQRRPPRPLRQCRRLDEHDRMTGELEDDMEPVPEIDREWQRQFAAEAERNGWTGAEIGRRITGGDMTKAQKRAAAIVMLRRLAVESESLTPEQLASNAAVLRAIDSHRVGGRQLFTEYLAEESP